MIRSAAFGAIVLFAALLTASAAVADDSLAIAFNQEQAGFELAANGHVAALVEDDSDYAVVGHAVEDLANDIREVTGILPPIKKARHPVPKGGVVLIGTLGHSAPVDALVQAGKLDVSRLRGAWESFLIATIPQSARDGGQMLVIVGSDRRGTAYGVYELSEAIGQSPWNWWADVPAKRHDTLIVPSGTRRFGPPSVKYRGIFINDEDWGLHPWAAKTFEPQSGGIGPKTYERVFELLLRLKANTLWPAMHKVSAPFNSYPGDAKLADEYAIVMGSSHAEPMLRDNVGEWKDAPNRFNYETNPKGVLRYWEERVKTNAAYESLWTVGMRGIHDSGMMGPKSLPDRVKLLDRVIADQRNLLGRYINDDVTKVPQIFVPYKEVLDLYRNGLQVPEDITLVWPDDNFGYLRHFPDDAERKRSGGSGIYYHLSYLGPPLSYIWLSTTPPALINEETQRAYDAGARRIWIANVGDIKPAEIDISFFLEQAWNIDRWRGQSQRAFLNDWATRTFGAAAGPAIGPVLDAYYTVNFQRRPEHLQWWLPGDMPRNSPLSVAEVNARVERFHAMTNALEPIEARLLPSQQDAFFELVEYPVRASAAANVRYFDAERYSRLIDTQPAAARAAGASARTADATIKALTQRYNTQIAGGKWRYVMAEEPADNQWRQIRISTLPLPAPGLVNTDPSGSHVVSPSAADLPNGDRCSQPAILDSASGWKRFDGLTIDDPTLVSARPDATARFHAMVTGEACDVIVSLLPTFANNQPGRLKLFAVVDGKAHEVRLSREAEKGDWSQAVLNNYIKIPLGVRLTAGLHQIEIYPGDAGIGIRGVYVAKSEK